MQKGKSVNGFPENKELVKLARNLLGITRKDLASFMGYSKQSLYFWEKEIHPVPLIPIAIFQQIFLVNNKGYICVLRERIKKIEKCDENTKTLKFLQAIYDFRLDKL